MAGSAHVPRCAVELENRAVELSWLVLGLSFSFSVVLVLCRSSCRSIELPFYRTAVLAAVL